jgi:hypothetical protein
MMRCPSGVQRVLDSRHEFALRRDLPFGFARTRGLIEYRVLGSNGIFMQRVPYLLGCFPTSTSYLEKAAW